MYTTPHPTTAACWYASWHGLPLCDLTPDGDSYFSLSASL